MDNQTVIQELVTTLQNSGIAVVRTDTIYGIVALASSEEAVEKVYAAKHRNASKQCIILVDEVPAQLTYAEQINSFSGGATLPTTLVVPATDESEWLLRGGDTIAYRVIKDPLLRSVIKTVGPIIAPSANPEGLEPARTIQEAQAYFGESVDAYIDGGEVPADVAASEILLVQADGTVRVIRSQFSSNTENSEIVIKEHYSAGGVIFKDNNVLLIHWDPPRSTYDFPKGGIDEGESPETAAVREVFEETGYKARIIKYIDSNDYYFQLPKGEWRHKTVQYFLMELADDTQYPVGREPYETFENVWVSIAEAGEVITKQINKDLFAKALELNNTLK